MTLRFSNSNRYLPDVWTFNLPSGFSCPAAVECLTTVDRVTNKMTAGKDRKYPCYSAMGERYPAVRRAVWENFYALASCKGDAAKMAELINSEFPAKAKRFRIHSGGDFFSQRYFDAWLEVVARRPEVAFWAFTKSVNFWVERLGLIPENLNLTASYGGRYDYLIAKHELKHCRVFNTMEEVLASGMPLDDNDALASTGTASFALLLNSTKSRMKKKGTFDEGLQRTKGG